MSWLAGNSFRVQVAVIGLASASVVALAAVLIRDVITSAERTLVEEALQLCSSAARELGRQYQDRLAYADERFGELPLQAQDLSLRGLARTVLRSYEGVEGGFYEPSTRTVIGYSGAAAGPSEAERSWIEAAVRQGVGTREEQRDLVVVAAQEVEPGRTASWAMKRLVGARDPVLERRRWWLAGLVFSTLLGVAGVASISIWLRRGVTGIYDGLRRMEEDYCFRFGPIEGDFGAMAQAINRMADRRAVLEAGLRRQDRLTALGKVVAGVAHEIRNPLNSVRLTLELVDRRLRRGVAASEEVAAALDEVDRLDRIVGRLLAFGRTGLEDRRLQDVAPLVRQAVRIVEEQCRQKDVRIDVELPDLRADLDGPQIEQVLINLLLNAIEASAPRGTVQLRARNQNGHIEITVRDSGPGIPDSVRDHVFDAYFTTKPNGTGLGLAVSSEIVASHGGRLEFDTGDAGTTFRLLLPLSRDLT